MISSLKSYILILSSVLFVLFLGQSLNPSDGKTFSGHDETQAARVIEFSENLRQGQIPPRISPNMSFGLGYPIFNYYAPTAYWITSFIFLIGLNVAQALEASYLLGLFVGMIGFYFVLRKYFTILPSCAGAALYISSPVIAVNIFVRGNLAEIWFYALFPWALALMQRISRKNFFLTTLLVAATFTAHNIFSLISVPLLFVFAWINKSKMQAFAVVAGLLISSSFLIPALGELRQVQASEIATITEYQDHFLCPLQLWSSTWGYGGSTTGCIDGMSFMLGKVQILAGISGLTFLAWNLIKRKKQNNMTILGSVIILTIGSLSMTLSFSQPLWELFEPILSIFQFPWRFLLFVIFGLSFLGAYAVHSLPKRYVWIGAAVFIILILGMNPKFFSAQELPQQEFLSKYASTEYIREVAAFKVAEYLPISAHYSSWRQLEEDSVKPHQESTGFQKYESEIAQTTVLPIHYAPYWSITIDGETYIPESFDNLGRPRIKVEDSPLKVTVEYVQTPLQNIGNTITLITGILVLIYSQPQKWRIKKT